MSDLGTPCEVIWLQKIRLPGRVGLVKDPIYLSVAPRSVGYEPTGATMGLSGLRGGSEGLYLTVPSTLVALPPSIAIVKRVECVVHAPHCPPGQAVESR